MTTLEPGCVPQRYCIAILQKLSIKDEVIPLYIKHDLILWSIELISDYKHKKIHVFCAEFASAMLANIIRTHSTVDYLERNEKYTAQVKLNKFITFLAPGIVVVSPQGNFTLLCIPQHSTGPRLVQSTYFRKNRRSLQIHRQNKRFCPEGYRRQDFWYFSPSEIILKNLDQLKKIKNTS